MLLKVQCRAHVIRTRRTKCELQQPRRIPRKLHLTVRIGCTTQLVLRSSQQHAA